MISSLACLLSHHFGKLPSLLLCLCVLSFIVLYTYLYNQCHLQSEATTSWDFATTSNSRLMEQQLSHSLASSIKNSKDHTTALKNYRTPAQNAAAVADKIKAARSQTVQQVAALEAKFGKEGAAEMLRIAGMRTTHINRRHRVRAVHVQPLVATAWSIVCQGCVGVQDDAA